MQRPNPVPAFLLAAAAAAAVLTYCAPAAASQPTMEARSGDASIRLLPVQGLCVGHARLAEFRTKADAKPVQGCWVGRITPQGPLVTINWLDGDRDDIPPVAFLEVEGA